MMTLRAFAGAVVPHGTAGIYMDPHEICNVLGARGVDLMLDEAACTPLKAMLTMPSCVPAVTGFEDTGASIDAGDVARYMQDGRVVALGEMMNYPGILSGQEGPHAIVAETLKAGRTVTGHYSIPRPTGASTATLPPEPAAATSPPGRPTPWPRCAWACTPCCGRAPPGGIWGRWPGR